MEKKQRTLKRQRSERRHQPTKRQLQHDRMMETLDGRLLLYCKLMGIQPEKTSRYVRCTMPSEAIQTVYKVPIRFVSYNKIYFYGTIYHPNRQSCRLTYLPENSALHLFEKLGEKIDELEGREVVSLACDTKEPPAGTPPESQQETVAEKDAPAVLRILTHIVQSIGWMKNTYKKKRTVKP